MHTRELAVLQRLHQSSLALSYLVQEFGDHTVDSVFYLRCCGYIGWENVLVDDRNVCHLKITPRGQEEVEATS
jgi:hypothetical protein